MNELETQVGGSHYKKLPYQPVELWANLKVNAFEGAMVKYITRYKDKNGVEDVDKVIHFWELYKKLYKQPWYYLLFPWILDTFWEIKMAKEVTKYCEMNNLSPIQCRALKCVLSRDFNHFAVEHWLDVLSKDLRK